MLGNTRSGRFPKTESARARVNTARFFVFSDFFAQHFGRGVFLWEKRVMIDLPIRSCVRPGFVWARRGRGFFATQRLQICGDWILSTQSSPMRGDWILSTQRLPIHWSLRDSRGDDIAFVSSQMQAKFRRRFRVVFS